MKLNLALEPFRPSTPRTGAEPHFRFGIDGAKPAEKGVEWKVRNHQKVTSTSPHRQKIISIRMPILYHFSIVL